jgi:hypothetical protein
VTVRIQNCDEGDARARIADARAQLEFAELAGSSSTVAERKASASAAVLAGIAAADAACCKALGHRSRSQSHADAVGIVRSIAPGGAAAARHLGRLLQLKDRARYGLDPVSGPQLTAAVRQARALVEFAAGVLER